MYFLPVVFIRNPVGGISFTYKASGPILHLQEGRAHGFQPSTADSHVTVTPETRPGRQGAVYFISAQTYSVSREGKMPARSRNSADPHITRVTPPVPFMGNSPWPLSMNSALPIRK